MAAKASASPDSLIQSAAPAPGNAPAPEPAPESGVAAPDTGELGKQLLEFLSENPPLMELVMGVIEKYVEGGMQMNGMMPPTGGMQGASMPNVPGQPGGMGAGGPVGGTGVGPVGGGMPPVGGGMPGSMPGMAPGAQPGGPQLPPELMQHLGTLTSKVDSLASSHAQQQLERELQQAEQEYAKLKEQIPTLPDLNKQELLQMVLDKGGISIKDALLVYAMQKALEGEGSLADRIMAYKMQNSKGAGLPRPEGAGGGIPTGVEAPPKTLKDASRRSKQQLLAAMVQGIGQ